jgi:hypothetical protein
MDAFAGKNLYGVIQAVIVDMNANIRGPFRDGSKRDSSGGLRAGHSVGEHLIYRLHRQSRSHLIPTDLGSFPLHPEEIVNEFIHVVSHISGLPEHQSNRIVEFFFAFRNSDVPVERDRRRSSISLLYVIDLGSSR